MSDREIIIQLLRNVEWRIRANRLLHELTSGLLAVLIFLIAFKIWDLFSPLHATTITSVIAACAFLFAIYAVWRVQKRGTLDEAAVSIDRKAGLHDEIKSALWFINNPRSSEWIERQIQRAAKKAGHINIDRTYPSTIPRASYIVAVTILLFVGLNFVPLPFNHNWLMLQAAPADRALDKELLQGIPDGFELGGRNLDPKAIREALEEIARHLAESELLQDVADALLEGDLQRAADELRNLAQQLAKATQEQTGKMREALLAAAANKKQGLEDVLEEFTETADALEEDDDIVIEEELEETAQQLEELGKKIPNQQLGTGFQSDKPTEEASGEATSQAPNSGQTAQKRSNTNGPGGTNPPPGGLAQLPPTSLETKLELDVKLQVEALKAIEGENQSPEEDEELSEASKQERSKLDYRNVNAESSPAQKDLLNQDQIPLEYRALIKSYFQAIRPPVKK